MNSFFMMTVKKKKKKIAFQRTILTNNYLYTYTLSKPVDKYLFLSFFATLYKMHDYVLVNIICAKRIDLHSVGKRANQLTSNLNEQY